MDQAAAVICEKTNGVATITFNRPRQGNALTNEVSRAFAALAEDATNDPEVGAIVLQGAGPNFCVGGDLNDISAGAEASGGFPVELVEEANRGIRILHGSSKVVIAAVHGAVAGAGVSFSLVADLVVADPNAFIVFAYPNVGLTGDLGVNWLLPRAVGMRKALAMTIGGEKLDAEEALRIGVITEISVPGGAGERAQQLAAQIASHAPEAFGECRRLIRTSWDKDFDTHLEDEAATMVRAIESERAGELMRAFLKK